MRDGYDRTIAWTTAWLAPLFAAGLLAGTPEAARGQAPGQGVGLEVNAGYYTLGGDDFEGIDAGPGFEAVASYGWAGGFALGVGAGIGLHDADAPDGAGAASSDLDLIGIFAQPVYRFNISARGTPHVHPFVGARIGYARLSSETEDTGTAAVEVSASGFSAGGLGGVEVWISDEVGLTGSALFDVLSFGDADVDGVTQADTDSSGTRLGFRGGLKVRFP